ncbi:MAG: hypothetical protein EOM55_00530 [Clostridia bacterium]|nr:hypothetical protein [Clostridia bacterium]
MKDNRTNLVLEKISDKHAEARAKELGITIPEKQTTAQLLSELENAHKEQGPFVKLNIDGVDYYGSIDAIKKVVDRREKKEKEKSQFAEELAM